MKRIIGLIIVACVAGIIVFLAKGGKPAEKPPVLSANTSIISPSPSPVAIKQSIVLNIDGTSIRVSWVIVNPNQVELYSNLKEQKLSEEIKVDKSCQILVNGGFYSKENTHLGLFITNFETVSPILKSPLLNGFLWINYNNVFIKNNPPDINPRIAIQSGPLLMQNSEPLILTINDDEPNRRIVAATTSDNK